MYDIISLKPFSSWQPRLRLTFHPIHYYTCLSPGIMAASRAPPPPVSPSYFVMLVPGICSNSSHPVGIGMPPPHPLSSLLYCLSPSISHTPAHVRSSRHGRPPNPTPPNPTHHQHQAVAVSFFCFFLQASHN